MKFRQILFAILLIISPLISFAIDYYKAARILYVRSGAGIEYPVSFTLLKGNEVEILSKNNEWYKIKYFKRTGYVYSKDLQYSRTISDTESDVHQQIVNKLLMGAYVSLALLVIYFLFKKTRKKEIVKIATVSRTTAHDNVVINKQPSETDTESNSGIWSERDLVSKLLRYGVPSQSIFHDLYVEKYKNRFSQIDLAVITKVGIIVFEVKDYSGVILGNGKESQWIQELAYGEKRYRFYNPIMQNNSHIAELMKQLYQFKNIPFYSIVVFYGDCVLKEINLVPKGTFIVKSERVLEVVEIILRDNKPVHYADENAVVLVLKRAVINGKNRDNQNQHIENIQDMLGKKRIFE